MTLVGIIFLLIVFNMFYKVEIKPRLRRNKIKFINDLIMGMSGLVLIIGLIAICPKL